MTHDDKEEIKAVIREVVNGKIDKLSQKLDLHMEDMRPVKDALNWVNTTQRFIKWTGVPIIVFGVWFFNLFK